MSKDDTEPDGLVIVFMSHFINRNIMLISGKVKQWSTEDVQEDILLVYHGENQYSLTDVGTYLSVCIIL